MTGRSLRRLLAGCIAGLVVALALLVLVGPRLPWGDGQASPGIGGPFTLEDPAGHPVHDRDFRGKWMLVYFGYTHCPDACPTALNDMANALDLLGPKRRDVAPLFITVDPERDDRKSMGDYVDAFSPQIVGLTGTPAQVAQAEKAYRVYAARHPDKDGGYSMDHSSIIYLMNPEGRFVTLFANGSNPGQIADKLRSLI